MEAPHTPIHRQLSRDQSLQARTLHSVGLQYAKIATQLDITQCQAQYACLTPQFHQRGTFPIINESATQVLYDFVCASRRNRRISIADLATALHWDISTLAIRNALKRGGFARHPARSKPKISEKNRIARLAWAHDHRYWTHDQWNRILWTDETWVTNKHRKIWITRRGWEALEDTCLIDKEARSKGWMFWGCFSGEIGLGPGLFWEKAWGSINQYFYQEHILPLIAEWIR